MVALVYDTMYDNDVTMTKREKVNTHNSKPSVNYALSVPSFSFEIQLAMAANNVSNYSAWHVENVLRTARLWRHYYFVRVYTICNGCEYLFALNIKKPPSCVDVSRTFRLCEMVMVLLMLMECRTMCH